jgi:uncharacterized protein YndB with AHSA1/START domain
MTRAEVERTVPATRQDVWQVLLRPENYPRWIVGAKEFRGADDSWPQAGSRFYHSVGIGPLTLKDETELISTRDGVEIVLLARARPAGRARVTLTLEDDGDGTRVHLEEHAVTGPGAYLPHLLHDPFVGARNTKALRRLSGLLRPGRA